MTGQLPVDLLGRWCAEHNVPFEVEAGHETRTSNPNGSFHPVGFMLHHTASPRGSNARGYVVRTAASQFFVQRDGTLVLVADGRTRHPGRGSSKVLAEVVHDTPVDVDAADRGLVDDTDGYAFFVGVEVDNDGRGEPYAPAVIDATIHCAAMVCALHGWPATRVIHHRQWTRRKVDMSLRDDLRPAIAKRITELATGRDTMATLADPQPQWAQEGVAWALANGVSRSDRDADAPVSARELMVMLHRVSRLAADDARLAAESAVAALPPSVSSSDARRIAEEAAASAVLRARLTLP